MVDGVEALKLMVDGVVAWEKSGLPAGYKLCNYLESTGTQWIDTLIVPSETLTTTVKQAFTGDSIITNSSIFGSRGNGDTRYWVNYDGQFEIGYGIWISTGVNTTPYTINTIVFNEINEGIHCFTYNDKRFEHSGTPNNSVNIVLFGRNHAGSIVIAKQRIYSFSMKDPSGEVLNFIPCLDESGIPCMFDTVSKQPFYNQGTGEFLYELA